MDREFFEKTGKVLWGFSFLVGLLWFVKQQTALFLTMFLLLPLWALWIWRNPYLGEKNPAEGGVDNKET